MPAPTPPDPAVGASVRAARIRRGVTLRALAGAVGVSAATLSDIERGHTPLTVDRLRRIADVLDVPATRLLRDDDRIDARPDDPDADTAGQDWRTYEPQRLDPVLAAAIGAFVEVGYHGASVRAIALRAGLSVPGVYHHYASKHDLLVAAFDLTLGELSVRLEGARRGSDDPTGRYALVVESLALFHLRRRELAFIGASEMRSLQPEERARIAAWRTGIQRDLEADLAAALAAAGRPSPGPHTGKAVATMCTSLAQWFDPSGPDSAEDTARDYARLALAMAGLTPGPPTSPSTDDQAEIATGTSIARWREPQE